MTRSDAFLRPVSLRFETSMGDSGRFPATISGDMRYHIWTEGCQMNEADSEKLAAGLAKLGWEEAARADEADLAVVNTCVVRQKAEDRAAGYLGTLRKLKKAREGERQIG